LTFQVFVSSRQDLIPAKRVAEGDLFDPARVFGLNEVQMCFAVLPGGVRLDEEAPSGSAVEFWRHVVPAVHSKGFRCQSSYSVGIRDVGRKVDDRFGGESWDRSRSDVFDSGHQPGAEQLGQPLELYRCSGRPLRVIGVYLGSLMRPGRHSFAHRPTLVFCAPQRPDAQPRAHGQDALQPASIV
jgi:hypothetical protein